MQRRAYLAGLCGSAAALAGCTALSGGTPGDDDDDRTPTADPPPTDPPNGGPSDGRTSIVDLETVSRTYALTPTTYHADELVVETAFTATATADHPSTVRATLRNRADYENTFRLRWLPPFGRNASTNPREPGSAHRHGNEHTYRAALVLAPTGDHDLVDDPPAVERDADGLWRAADVTQWLPESVRLGPGETVEGEYHLVGHPDGAGDGRPTGVYEFTRPDEPSMRVAVWETDRPGPDESSRFAGESVPALRSNSSTAWYHDADATTASYVQPSVERTDLPAAVSFTFVNHARASTSCGHWNLYKLVDDGWYHLGPTVHLADCRSVVPGDTKQVTVRAFHREGLGCDGCRCGRDFTFDHLGGGRYAMVAGYGHATARSAAMVAFDAPPVEVSPTDDVSTERDGATVTVTSERYGDEDERWDDARFEARHVDGADERLIPEQVMQRRSLRNTLPFFETGVDRVVLRTNERTAGPLGVGADSHRFRFRGEAYEVRRTDG